MQLKKLIVLVLSFVILSVPVVPITASSAAVQMFTKGSARINGVLAPSVTSLFSGDQIVTGKESTTSLSFAGGDAVLLSQMSKASMTDDNGRVTLKLEGGMVSTLDRGKIPIVIEAHGARILSAGNQTAVYEVFLSGNSLRVVARGGVARVETANRTADLQPGTELDATLAPPDPSPSPANAGMSQAERWIILGSIAGSATGIALGVIAIQKVNNCHLSPGDTAYIC